ncbi:MAG: TRAM domain-containing protein [Mycobacteriales bacterium]
MSAPGRAGVSSGRRKGPPGIVLEGLRFLVVVFFAGAGYQLGAGVGGANVLGALNGTAVGLIIGSGLGYVLGGVLGRTTASSAESVRTHLHDTSAEELVAGALGVIGGVLLGAGVAWPVFLLRQPVLSFPLFAFVCTALGYVGFLVGASKRDGVLAMFGDRAGLAPREVAAAALPRVIDTSVAIDGRVVDVVRAGFLHGTVLVPTPVLAELQGFADAADDVRRAKGRRGLEVLETLKREPGVDVQVLELDVPAVPDVDGKLVRICLDRGAALLTLDTNLAKAAGLAGVRVLNLHALALALRPPVVAGEDVQVLLLKPGKEPGQAVGYLDDGSMVVVEQARERLGSEVGVQVTSVVTTANGRLVFGRLTGAGDRVGRPARRRTLAPSPPLSPSLSPSPASVPPRT